MRNGQVHTDSAGPIAYNDSLSSRRAESVKEYLVSRHSVSADQIRTLGKGESEPIQPNDTDAHRSMNRRVEFVNWTALEKIRQEIRDQPRRSGSDFDQFFNLGDTP